MFLAPARESDVFSSIMSLKNDKSMNRYNIKTKQVKYVLNEISHCLSYNYSLSLTTGVFSYRMKLARLVVIHKGGDRSMMGDYRPVSILEIFPKVLDKIHSRLSSFCQAFPLRTCCQFGFRNHRSSGHALLLQNIFHT